MMDFTKIKKLFIGGMELKQLFIGNKFDNKVPKSIDMDGSIYQAGKGYIDEYRLSSSGGLSGQANTVTTGFIEYQAGDLIRMSGVDWKPAITSETRYCYLAFYNSQFNVLGSINCFNTTDVSSGYNGIARGICTFKNGINMPSIANGVTTFDNINFSDTTQIAYFRVNGYGSGADMIVTVDEEIGMHQIWKSGYKNWVKYSTEADGVTIYNGGLGYKDNCRVRSGGEEAANIAGSCSGYIPVNGGDIIRVATTGTGTGDRFTDGGASSAINVFGASSGKPGDNLGQVVGNSNGYGIFASDAAYGAYNSKSVIQKDSYWQWTVPPADSGIAFIRVSGYTNPDRDSTYEELIVTINEEIA